MGASFGPVGRNGGGTADSDEGNVCTGQLYGTVVGPARNRLGGLHGSDLVRPLTEEIRERPFGIGYEHFQYRL